LSCAGRTAELAVGVQQVHALVYNLLQVPSGFTASSSKKKKKRGYRVCSSGYAATDTS
jgi:hypothetical protein